MEQDASEWNNINVHIYCTSIKKHLKFLMKATVYPDYIHSMAAAQETISNKLKAAYWLW
jgi:GMP synthase PP-ATPase subunit